MDLVKNMSETKCLEVLSQNIAGKIGKLAIADCNGCQISHPSQREHTCLGIDYHFHEVDNVDLYFTQVFENQRQTIIQEVLECLNMPVEFVQYYYQMHEKEIYTRVNNIYNGRSQ